MGWTYKTHPGGLKELLEERSRGWENQRKDGSKAVTTLLARCFKGMPTHGGNLWKVYEQTVYAADGSVLKTGRFIALDLIACSKGCWGYKDLEESDGPCEVNCPLSYIEMVPGGEGFAPAWKQRVRDFHASQVKPELGKTYKLKKNSWGVETAKVLQLRPLIVQTEIGKTKISRRLLAGVL